MDYRIFVVGLIAALAVPAALAGPVADEAAAALDRPGAAFDNSRQVAAMDAVTVATPRPAPQIGDLTAGTTLRTAETDVPGSDPTTASDGEGFVSLSSRSLMFGAAGAVAGGLGMWLWGGSLIAGPWGIVAGAAAGFVLGFLASKLF